MQSGPVFSHIHCLAFHNSTIVTYTKFLSASKGSDRSSSRFGDELKSMLDGIRFDLPPDLPDPRKVAIVVPPLPLVAMSPKGRRRSRVATGLSLSGSVTAGIDSYDDPISIPTLRSDLPAKSIAKKQVRDSCYC
ncbi:MAG: hypothetical protein KVP17_002900 [Porospora cf. gigantea B]|uniref:uncharacterized protein n=1 Tax=Porospora cf. gigantea B TaxID=2853592 RepID=UPI003571BB2D|nr:MAG: hypothetical protein KVP17_002900 [Porospora cf. gigantea B]